MTVQPYQPQGFEFLDRKERHCLYVTEGDWRGWICQLHPDGFWVAKRIATTRDLQKIQERIALGN
jgi:hypothetical protein